MSSGIDQRPCPALDLGIISFSSYILLDLFHISLPIDFSIYINPSY